MPSRHSRAIRTCLIGHAIAAAPLLACGDDGACEYAVCDATNPACAEHIAEVVACKRGVPVASPTIRVLTRAVVVEERQGEPLSAEQEQLQRDYYGALALYGLMPSDYEPADATADHYNGVAAYYSPADEEIVIISDSGIEDPLSAYLLLVHEMVHASQDATWDLEGLSEKHATTSDRFFGMRAMWEGDAVLYADLAGVELRGLDPFNIDWDGYFADYQTSMLEEARQTSIPSLRQLLLFPYAFGGEYVFDAWAAHEEPGVEEAVTDPADSVRQVMLGYPGPAREDISHDAELDPHALPEIDGRTLLSYGHFGVWMISAALQRTAGSEALFEEALFDVESDFFSAFRDDATGELVAFWRIQPAGGLMHLIDRPESVWVLDPAITHSHVARVVDGDLVLVATTGDDAGALFDSVQGWTHVDQARSAVPEPERPDRLARRPLACAHPRTTTPPEPPAR